MSYVAAAGPDLQSSHALRAPRGHRRDHRCRRGDERHHRVGAGPGGRGTGVPRDRGPGHFTGTFTFDIPDAAAAAFFEIETTGGDVVSFRDLAHARTPVGTLYSATEGSPRSSRRWREVLSPLGWGDEVRAAVRSGGTTVGYLCLHRETGDRPFSVREVARLSTLLPLVGGAMRRSALPLAAAGERLETGVLLVDGLGRVAGATGGAESWLEELGPPLPGGLPLLLAGLVRVVLESGLPATSSLTTRSGRAGVVEVALLEGSAAPQVAVVLSDAPPGHRLDRLAILSGLTAREREVVGCLLRGSSTSEVADELSISPYTVQAHHTSVFAKTGLRSRRELVSRLRR
jgi:DNA-binding CsgD family transcriptional regulator